MLRSEICIIGNKGVVGSATYELFSRLGYGTTGMDRDESIPEAHTYFICVNENEVEGVVEKLSHMWKNALVVIRSTTTPNTITKLTEKYNLHISHNPEFLREAMAVLDEFNPYRIVIGECCKTHGDYLEALYKPLYRLIVRVSPTMSEWVKLASNCYLASTIAFWNTIDFLAEKDGISGSQIGMIASLDPRISSYGSRYHHKYGGKCLPKDISQLIEYSKELGCNAGLLEAIEKSNDET